MKILFLWFIQFTADIKQDFNLSTRLWSYNNYLTSLFSIYLFIILYLHLIKNCFVQQYSLEIHLLNYTRTVERASIKSCFFSSIVTSIVTFIGSYAGRKNFRFVGHACRLCARNKIRRSPGTEHGPIKFAKLKSDYSGLWIRDKGWRRKRERKSFHLSREIWKRITDSMWRRRLLVP